MGLSFYTVISDLILGKGSARLVKQGIICRSIADAFLVKRKDILRKDSVFFAKERFENGLTYKYKVCIIYIVGRLMDENEGSNQTAGKERLVF